MQIISSYADETVIMLRSFEADPKSSMMDPLHPLVLSLCRHIKELPLVTFQPRLSPILLHFLLLSHSIRCSTCNQFPGLAGSSSEVQVIIQVCLFTHPRRGYIAALVAVSTELKLIMILEFHTCCTLGIFFNILLPLTPAFLLCPGLEKLR